MPSTSHILRRFYADVWEDGRLDMINAYFAPASENSIMIDDRRVEPDEIEEWMKILFSLTRDIRVAVVHTLDDGDWASALMRVNCTSRATGAKVEIYQQVMSRQKDGRLVESYPQFDFLRFFEQLGQLPQDAYPLLMAGNDLG